MKETELQRQIKKALESAGVWVIRTQVKGSNGRRAVATGEPGMPDLYLPGLGHLEVKLPGEMPSAAQASWHERARAAGVRVEVVHSLIGALATVSLWQMETGAVVRASHLRVVR